MVNPFRSPLWFDKITILGLLKAKTGTNSAIKVKVVTFLTLICFAMYNWDKNNVEHVSFLMKVSFGND